MNEQVKALLEKLELSEDTAKEIQNVLTEAFVAAKKEGEDEAKAAGKEEGKAEAKEEADKEKEELKEAHEAEITLLKEKAEEYGVFLKEKANDYGDYLKEKANTYGEHIKESVSEKMKEYADYAVENFIAENRERFVETEEYARMKSAIEYIKEAFEKNAFTVREDVAVAELQESLAESTRQYEALFEDLAMAREELDKANRTMILERATADLAETQKEKVNELLEAVSFDSIEEYTDGVAMIVEQAKAVSAAVVVDTKEELLKEESQVSSTPVKTRDPGVAAYMSRPGLF
jgi:hypothetical protein